MQLTKIDTGQFQGTKGKTANLVIAERTTGTLVQMISAVYGMDVLDPEDDKVPVKVQAGKKPLTIVYSASQAGAWIDLFETDATGARQKLRANVFDPAEPTIHIEVVGAQ